VFSQGADQLSRLVDNAGFVDFARHVLQRELLDAAHRARSALIDAQLGVDQARAEYEHAVRRLHAGGATLREIAEALGVSHQRVHQIVDNGPMRRRWRRRAGDPPRRTCSFCGIQQPPARSLIAGPSVYICDRCIALATTVAATREAGRNDRVRIEPVEALPGIPTDGADRPRGRRGGRPLKGPVKGKDAASAEGCSFCGKGPDQVASVVGTPAAQICSECLDLCREIIGEEGTD